MVIVNLTQAPESFNLIGGCWLSVGAASSLVGFNLMLLGVHSLIQLDHFNIRENESLLNSQRVSEMGKTVS